jgi:hypothetical protein
MSNTPTPIEIPSGYTAKIDGNQITFEPVKNKYPTWEDAEEKLKPSWIDISIKTGQVDEVFTTLKRLQWLRNEWNRIDGFVVDWEHRKWVIKYNVNEPIIDFFYVEKHFLFFKSEPTAQLFLDTFRDKIEMCKEFIN